MSRWHPIKYVDKTFTENGMLNSRYHYCSTKENDPSKFLFQRVPSDFAKIMCSLVDKLTCIFDLLTFLYP